jgi:hypothetical protein
MRPPARRGPGRARRLLPPPTRLSSAKDFTESWNGSRWSRTPVPDKGLAGGFFGVSCASASTCTAAGGYTTTVGQGQRLVIAWTVAL